MLDMTHRRPAAKGCISSTLTGFQAQLNLSWVLSSRLLFLRFLKDRVWFSNSDIQFSALTHYHPCGSNSKLYLSYPSSQKSLFLGTMRTNNWCFKILHILCYLPKTDTCKPPTAPSPPQVIPLKFQTRENCILIILDTSVPANLAVCQQLLMEMSRQWATPMLQHFLARFLLPWLSSRC